MGSGHDHAAAVERNDRLDAVVHAGCVSPGCTPGRRHAAAIAAHRSGSLELAAPTLDPIVYVDRRCTCRRRRDADRRCADQRGRGSCAAPRSPPKLIARSATSGQHNLPAGLVVDDTATRHELAVERRDLRETLADTVRWLAARGLITARQAGSLAG